MAADADFSAIFDKCDTKGGYDGLPPRLDEKTNYHINSDRAKKLARPVI